MRTVYIPHHSGSVSHVEVRVIGLGDYVPGAHEDLRAALDHLDIAAQIEIVEDALSPTPTEAEAAIIRAWMRQHHDRQWEHLKPRPDWRPGMAALQRPCRVCGRVRKVDESWR